MMRRIIINSRFLTQQITGTQRFAIEISRQLKKIDSERFVFVSPRNIIHKDLAKELDAQVLGLNTGHIWEQIDLPIWLRKNRNPLLLNLANTAPILYKNKLSTIMDLSWLHFPKSVSPNFYFWYKYLIPRVVRTSKLILTISDFSGNDLLDKFLIDRGRIFNVGCSYSGNFKLIDLQREKIILSVASIQSYKNLRALIDAFIVMKNRNFFDYRLILVGGYNSSVFSETNLFDVSENRKDIFFAGYLPDEKLIEYYNKARLFVFPSFFEGFGIPPLEAMACGCPCVVSKAASLPEVCGDAAYYVNPHNVEDIMLGMEKVLSDNDLSGELIKKGFENIKRFSWEKSAKKINDIINDL